MIFVYKAFLSHRYGFRDIPNSIDENEFDIVKEELKSIRNIELSYKFSGEGLHIDMENIFTECYNLDLNEMPKKYKLLFIDEIIVGYDASVNKSSKIFLEMNFLFF